MIPKALRRRFVRLSMTFLCLFPFFLRAQVIYVQPSGTGDGSSWNQASAKLAQVLETASEGTEIWVAEGIYYPTSCVACTDEDRALAFTIPNGVALYGGFAGNETERGQRDWLNRQSILSGDINQDDSLDSNSFSVVYMENVGTHTILDGFTIRAGNANKEEGFPAHSVQSSGAGIYNMGSVDASPTIRNCRLENHFSNDFGAAIYNNGRDGGRSNPMIRNCVFWSNESYQSGAGIFNDAGRPGSESSPIISDCTFELNRAKYGASIYNSGLEGRSSPQVLSCTFLDNEASSYGGGAYNFGKNGGAAKGLYANCVFAGNKASSAGAIYSLADDGDTQPVIVNCTFYDNFANTGGAVYCNESDDGNTEVTMANCIFWNNTAVFNPIFHMSGNGTPIMNLSHSLLDANDCDDIMYLDPHDSLNCVGGLIFNQTPAFVDASNRNFHLSNSSMVKDIGDNAILSDRAIYFDHDSLIRIHNDWVDLGAFEFDAPVYIAPQIVKQPLEQVVCEGENLEFSVEVSGTGTISYQWEKEGLPIPEATTPILSIPMAGPTDQAAYRCKVTSFVMDVIYSEMANAVVNTPAIVTNEIVASTNDICFGEMVTFTALAENGGGSPSYQWQVNGVDVGANSVDFSSSTLNDNDVVTCWLTSSLSCVNDPSALSNTISIDVESPQEVGISIAASSSTICAGSAIDFTATGINLGDNPLYQWQVNGTSVGDGAPNFTSDQLIDTDLVTCIVTSSLACVSHPMAVSNVIAVSVEDIKEVSVNISADATAVCEGTSITFMAEGINGGDHPMYQWRINGEEVGSNAPTFSSSDWKDNDLVHCVFTSSLTCTSSSSVNSGSVLVNILPYLNVAVNIEASTLSACEGEPIGFTATGSHPGDDPIYEWFLNGAPVDQLGPHWETTNLLEGDLVTCVLHSSLPCLNANAVASNPIQMQACTSTATSSLDRAAIQLFPNPTSGIFQLQLPQIEGAAELYLFDLVGKKHCEMALLLDGEKQQIDLSSVLLLRGIYVLKLRMGSRIWVEKLSVHP
ncbi:MAG: immunoglobulin domain-containing protein [Bacteroidota bacterium]